MHCCVARFCFLVLEKNRGGVSRGTSRTTHDHTGIIEGSTIPQIQLRAVHIHSLLPSYVKAKPTRVPTIAPTVTFTYLCFALVVAAVRHAIVVSDVHDDEEHPKSPCFCTAAVGVKPYIPKFNPVSVTYAPPLIGTFDCFTSLTTGAADKAASSRWLSRCFPTHTSCHMQSHAINQHIPTWVPKVSCITPLHHARPCCTPPPCHKAVSTPANRTIESEV